jgi:hypothetical protein
VQAGGSVDDADHSRSLAERSKVQTAAEPDSAALSRRSGECQTASTAARRTALGAAGFRGVTTISGRRGMRYQVSAYHGGRQYFIGWFQGEPAFAAWCFDVFVLRLKGADALPKLNFGSLAVQHLGWDVGSIPAGGDPTFLGEYAITRGRGSRLTMPALPSLDAVTAALPASNPLRLLVERKTRKPDDGDGGAEGPRSIDAACSSRSSDSAFRSQGVPRGSHEGSAASSSASAPCPTDGLDAARGAAAGVATAGVDGGCDVVRPGAPSASSAVGERTAETRRSGVQQDGGGVVGYSGHQGLAVSSTISRERLAAAASSQPDAHRDAVAWVSTVSLAPVAQMAMGLAQKETRAPSLPGSAVAAACELPASSSSAGTTTLAMHAAGLRSLDGSDLCASTAGGSAAARMLQ